jgi:hypothetical protein
MTAYLHRPNLQPVALTSAAPPAVTGMRSDAPAIVTRRLEGKRSDG